MRLVFVCTSIFFADEGFLTASQTGLMNPHRRSHCERGKRGRHGDHGHYGRRGRHGKRGKRGKSGKQGTTGPQGPQGSSGIAFHTIDETFTANFTYTVIGGTVNGSFDLLAFAPDGTLIASETFTGPFTIGPGIGVNITVPSPVFTGPYTIVLLSKGLSGGSLHFVVNAVTSSNPAAVSIGLAYGNTITLNTANDAGQIIFVPFIPS